MEKKAKFVEKKYGYRKKERESRKNWICQKTEELKKKLSVVKDKETKIEIQQKIERLKKEADKIPPPPPKAKS